MQINDWLLVVHRQLSSKILWTPLESYKMIRSISSCTCWTPSRCTAHPENKNIKNIIKSTFFLWPQSWYWSRNPCPWHFCHWASWWRLPSPLLPSCWWCSRPGRRRSKYQWQYPNVSVSDKCHSLSRWDRLSDSNTWHCMAWTGSTCFQWVYWWSGDVENPTLLWQWENSTVKNDTRACR